MQRILTLTLLATTSVGCTGTIAVEQDAGRRADAAPTFDAGVSDAEVPNDAFVPRDSPPAVVIDAASCELADVQAAVDSAEPGNIVRVPVGTCTWGAGGARLNLNQEVVVEGADREGTVIVIADDAGRYTDAVIRLNAAATVRSLTILTSTTGNSGTAFSASANGFRISEITYEVRTTSINGYFLYAGAYGLVDGCDITGGAGNNELIFARGPEDSWQTEHSIGGEDNLFIEDCTFGGQGYLTDCNSNSRCVVRFNTVNAGMKIDGHGKASNTPPRGVRHMEVYENEWTVDAGFSAAIEIRGGGGRVFANRAFSTHSGFFLTDYAASAAWPNFGGVIQTPADYPIDDQIGVGRDPEVGGSEPMYLWLNRAEGAPWPITLSYSVPAETMRMIIAADRDYYNEVPAFDGSSGVGVGTAAARDAISPSRTGVGFWTTDEGDWNSRTAEPDGVLYVWDGSAWNVDYEPYPYPHPRREP